MQIIPYGNEALLINFTQRIDPAINRRVYALMAALRKADLPGIRFTIPAYCSLTVGFDSAATSFAAVRRQVEDRLAVLDEAPVLATRQWYLPVCFGEKFAWDRGEVLRQTGLAAWNEVIDLFTERSLRVYLLGFLPGFPYLGALPEVLSCTRKADPRPLVPAQSVGIAGRQAGIYPSASPGGWQLIGRMPVPLFIARETKPFLLAAGDELSFYAVDEAHYAEIAEGFRTGEARWSDFSRNQ